MTPRDRRQQMADSTIKTRRDYPWKSLLKIEELMKAYVEEEMEPARVTLLSGVLDLLSKENSLSDYQKSEAFVQLRDDLQKRLSS